MPGSERCRSAEHLNNTSRIGMSTSPTSGVNIVEYDLVLSRLAIQWIHSSKVHRYRNRK